ncbi:Chromo (CHRromatin Organization MOdifier) domain [Phytophthora infestans]|uniref:Chromo (CHRromatin Organization MOdifier) domain n=1 Tax=Phytophthora infestans TaxID=4787 RepID=A0A8S9VB58_PHYIN|nr:Chromo (CHRromatin Organization MOdifier) domain [Phytophthora infestans]
MKYFHDRNFPDYKFAPGDQVLLDTTHLDLHHLYVSGKRKLAPRYIGPYPVLKLTTPDTYQVQLPPGLKLHNEFHISYLRPYEFDANPRRLNDVLRLLPCEGHEGFQVQRILDRRVLKGIIQYKVRWYGRDNKDSWEPESELTQASGLITNFLQDLQSTSRRLRSGDP